MFLVNFTYYILQPNMFNTDWQPLLQASYSHKNHCVKCFRIQNYSGPHFSRIFPHSDCISVSLCIQSECGKMREKCSISPYSVRMRENAGKMQYLSVFSPNAGKWGKNADQNNSKYGLFLGSDIAHIRSSTTSPVKARTWSTYYNVHYVNLFWEMRSNA